MDFIALENYKLAASYCRTSKRGGGVLILVHDHLSKNIVKISTIDQYCSDGNVEVCHILIKIGPIYVKIVCLYRSPAGNLNTFIQNLDQVLGKTKNNQQLIVAGDYNINLFENTEERRQLLNLFQSYGLEPSINEATRKTSRSNSLIDNIFVPVKIKNYLTKVLPITFSDHDAQIFICSSLRPIKEIQKTCKIRSFSEKNIKKFINLISVASWTNVLAVQDSDTCFTIFLKTFVKIFEESFPFKDLKINVHKKPWWNENLMRLKKELVASENLKYSLVNSDRQKYNDLRKRFRKSVESTKKLYNQTRIETSKNISKTLWEIFREEIGNADRFCPGIHLKQGGQLVDDPFEVAQLFNAVFADSSVDVPRPTADVSHIKEINHSIFFHPLTEICIEKIIKSLNNSKSCGVDEIPIKIIKLACSYISTPLAHCINQSFRTGIFPKDLKTTLVKPLYKKGDNQLPNNYRGIFLSTNFSKIFESALKVSLNKFFIKNNSISKHQHGFVKGKSTSSAIATIIQQASTLLSKKQEFAIIFIDLSRAFDNVIHELLLKKLGKYGVRGIACNLIHSYLEGRRQLVVIDHESKSGKKERTYSDPASVNKGTFAGSILGPDLFNIYLNDLFSFLEKRHSCQINFQLVAYADDITMMVTNKLCHQLYTDAQTMLNSIHDWCALNGLSINCRKTQFLYFKQNISSKFPPLKIEGEIVGECESANFLGIQMNNVLTWQPHILTLQKKLNKVCFLFKNIRDSLTQAYLITVYHAHFQSLARYGIQFWGHDNISSLLITQKRCVRTIFKLCPLESCRPYFKKYKIATIYNLYILESLLFVHRNKNSFFQSVSSVHSYTTRNALNVYRDRTSQHLSVKIYNHVPKRLKSLSNSKFKTNIRKMLANTCFYSMAEYFDHKFEDSFLK